MLINNPSLKEIRLSNCNIGPLGVNVIAYSLLNRSEDTLELLDLSGSNFGGIDLDGLVWHYS